MSKRKDRERAISTGMVRRSSRMVDGAKLRAAEKVFKERTAKASAKARRQLGEMLLRMAGWRPRPPVKDDPDIPLTDDEAKKRGLLCS